MNEAWPIAIDFFRELGDTAAAADTQVVLEANPVEYGADFLTNTADALRLVRDIDHPGIALHIDTACMHMAGEQPEVIMKEAGPLFRHFHVSERNLGVVGSTSFPHEQFARALESVDYQGWISIEMRAPEPFSIDAIKHAVRLVRETYG
jgi:D-psicose/D-tagatose/L-ribulose 3-epimerase